MPPRKSPPKPNPLIRLYEPPPESEPDMALFRSFAVVVLPGLPAVLESVPDGRSQQADAAAQDFAHDYEVSDECDEDGLIEIDAAHLPAFQQIIRQRNELGRKLADAEEELRAARAELSRMSKYINQHTATLIGRALEAATELQRVEDSPGDPFIERIAGFAKSRLIQAANEYVCQLQKASVQA